MISFTHKGDFNKTEKFLKTAVSGDWYSHLDEYAQRGVEALRSATPVDTGKTAASWGYEITKKHGEITIQWTNDNINKGVNIALILQLGHGTGWGGYFKGYDYINPSIRPIFDAIANGVWEEVKRS